jgi:lipopolysaccharide/colanic/teichoic acid biosynthesis glycosyltransferase
MPRWSRGSRLVAKRVTDVAVAAAALAIASPVIGAAIVAVKLDSPGPVLYRSRRLGKDAKPFDLLKLRTMSVSQADSAPQVTAADDDRITRVGRWLRRTKIDELPQLWNVLVGDVSLVGPRPEVQRYIERYPQEYREILRIRPGLTDRATLAYVDEERVLAGQPDAEQFYIAEVMPRKIRLYLEYVRNPSLREDFAILGRTAFKLVQRVLRTARAF